MGRCGAPKKGIFALAGRPNPLPLLVLSGGEETDEKKLAFLNIPRF
jgi:hypothetical protein